jgi:hypothetical protein
MADCAPRRSQFSEKGAILWTQGGDEEGLLECDGSTAPTTAFFSTGRERVARRPFGPEKGL